MGRSDGAGSRGPGRHVRARPALVARASPAPSRCAGRALVGPRGPGQISRIMGPCTVHSPHRRPGLVDSGSSLPPASWCCSLPGVTRAPPRSHRRSPRAPAAAPREVNIVTRDYAYVPSVVDLVPGETVVLHVINGGLVVHEAILGDMKTAAGVGGGRGALRGFASRPDPGRPGSARLRRPAHRRGLRRAAGRDLDRAHGRRAGGGRVVRRVPHPRPLGEGHGGPGPLRRRGRTPARHVRCHTCAFARDGGLTGSNQRKLTGARTQAFHGAPANGALGRRGALDRRRRAPVRNGGRVRTGSHEAPALVTLLNGARATVGPGSRTTR